MGVLLVLLFHLFSCRYTSLLLFLVGCVGVRVEWVLVGRWDFLGVVGCSLVPEFLSQLFLLCLQLFLVGLFVWFLLLS